MRKRMISTLMALCMALTLLPVQVLAANYAVGEDAGVSVQAGGTGAVERKAATADELYDAIRDSNVDKVTLTADVSITSRLVVERTLTVDLNGHVLQGNGSTTIFFISSGAALTLEDSDPEKIHYFTNNGDVWAWDDTATDSGLSVSGGVITGGVTPTQDAEAAGVWVNGGASFTMNGGHIVGCTTNRGDRGTAGVYNNGTFTMNGGSIRGCVSRGFVDGCGGVYNDRAGTMIANGGRVSDCSGYKGVLYNAGTIRAEGQSGTVFEGSIENRGTVDDSAKAMVLFDTDGGDNIAAQMVLRGQPASRPGDPTREGYEFVDWRLENGTPYGFDAPVLDAVTLKAQWRKVVPGSGTEQDPYRISNAEELQAFRDIVNGKNGRTQNTAACAVLTADIDLENQLWTPIGIWQNQGIQQPYSGTFDGGGYAIRNPYVNNGEAYTGLFGGACNAVFRNLTITGSVTASASSSYGGGLLGNGMGTITITNCINAAAVTSSEAAGLVGIFTAQDQTDTLTITGCANLGTVTAKSLRAGIIGQINGVGVISDCYNAGEIKSSEAEDYAYAGGIAAWASLGNDDPTGTLTFRSCYNVGALKKGGVYRTGGIVGRVIPNYTLATERYRLENCYYLDTTADKAAGGDYTVVGESAARTAAAFADGTVLAGLIAGRSVHPWDTDCGSKRLSGSDMRLPVLAWQKLTTEHEGGTVTCASGAVCDYCGKAYGDKNAANHTGGTEMKNAKAATCTADGYTGDTYCKGCSVKLQSGTVIKAAGHTGGTATCVSAAVCAVCKQTYGDKDAGNHTGGTEVKNAKAATCTADGYTGDTYCKGCGVELQSGTAIKATGHTGGTATCISGALCTVCGQAYGTVDAGNHDLKRTAAKEPGVFVSGHIEYWQCSACGKYFADANGAKEISQSDTIIPRRRRTADSEGGKASPATFDAGIGVCAVTAVTSLAGLTLLRRKRRDGE